MQLFQRGSVEGQPASAGFSSSESQPTKIDNELVSDFELWTKRGWLWAGYGLAAVLLLVWGFVILPENGLISWLWWPVAFGAIGVGGWLHWRQVRAARQRLAEVGRLEHGPGRFPVMPIGLGLVLVAGMALTTWITVNYPHALRHDSYQYSLIAYDYAQNGYTPHAIRMPGHTLLVAGIFKLAGGPVPEVDYLFGPPQAAGRDLRAVWVAQALLMLLTAAATYGLVAELRRKNGRASTNLKWGGLDWGDPVGLLAAGLVGLCPFLIAYVGLPLTEVPAAFWLTIVTFWWVKGLKYQGVALYGLLTGVGLAMLLMTRPTFIYLPILVLVTFAIWGRGWRGRVWQVGLVTVPLILFIWPQFAANLNTFDEPSPVMVGDFSTHQLMVGVYYVSVGGLPRYQEQVSGATFNPIYEPIWDRLRNYLPVQMGEVDGKKLSKEERKRLAHAESDYFKQYFIDYVKSKPLEFAGTVGKRLWFMWDQHYVFPYYDPGYFEYRWLTDNLNRLYLIAGLVGLFAAIWRWGRLAWPLWLGIGYLTLVNAVVVIEFRYTLPAYPLLLAFAALGLAEIGAAIIGRRTTKVVRRNVLLGTGAAILVLITLSLALPLIPPTNVAREKALDVLAQANDLNEVNQFRMAEELYNQAIAMYPTEAQLWSGRGNFFTSGRRPQKALPDFNKAIELDPQAVEPYRWRGEALAELKRNPEAVADYQKFLQLAPANNPARLKVERELQRLKALP